jgi:hypothetical protein
MEKDLAFQLGNKLISSQRKHLHYDRVVKMAERYTKLITGEGCGSMLIRYNPRESAEAMEQRERITQVITSAMAESLMTPFDRAARSNKVKKRFEFGDSKKNEAVQNMIRNFYGSKLKDTRGLDEWFNTRFKHLSFFDPNAWVVTEWENLGKDKEVEPYPYDIPARDAWDFLYKRNELRYLFVHKDITVEYLQDNGDVKEVDGDKYVLYEEDNTIVWCEVCVKLMQRDGIVIDESYQQLLQEGGKNFIVSFYTPNLGYAAAVRIGYKEDGATNGETYVNPFHAAMPFFLKSIKAVSEQDLSMTQHAFPQKLQYVEKCEGAPGTGGKPKGCHQGYVRGTTDKCTACDGKGYKYHTTAQDVILLPMPENKADMIDLNGMLVYKSPDIDLLKFQQEYIDGLKEQAHLAVFNSQMFLQPAIAKTATEIEYNTEGVYTAVRPYTAQISTIAKIQVYTFARLAGVAKPEDGEIVHIYPADPKLKTMGMLLAELKTANDSGGPSFLRDNINSDIAAIVYEGDPIGYMKYNISRRFFPFTGKSSDEITMLMASEFVSKFNKVLYANFENIFAEINLETPQFWYLNSINKQWEIVRAKVDEIMKEIDAGAPVINFNITKDTASTADDNNPVDTEDTIDTDQLNQDAGTDDQSGVVIISKNEE